MTSHDEGLRTSKPSSSLEESNSRILGAIVGTKNLTAPTYFIRGPRPMPRKNKDEQRESQLPRDIAEENPVLGQPKS